MALVAELDASVPESERGARGDAGPGRVVVDDSGHVVCEDPCGVVDRAGGECSPVQRDGRGREGARRMDEGECDEDGGECHGGFCRVLAAGAALEDASVCATERWMLEGTSFMYVGIRDGRRAVDRAVRAC